MVLAEAYMCSGNLSLTNIKCHIFDEKFVIFKECNNANGTLTVYAKLLQIPVTNCILRMEFNSMIASSIKFNTTWDACEFMRNRKRYRSLALFYKLIADNSNFNHSCPFNHDIIIRDLRTDDLNFFLPMISGSYKFNTVWIVNKNVRAKVGGIVQYVNNKKINEGVKNPKNKQQ
ncbi:hypothetical protein FF38_12206 [Lucilia cuprina]|uniref:MD-2-related lipid-recognition domain-containing protein n=1 Tax=Lucilia cuprina TaxID=7375 RepID=A0A0L0BR07_LUCCU|nr:hypothetical protein FF38_12206 [Lucilia cuprina]